MGSEQAEHTWRILGCSIPPEKQPQQSIANKNKRGLS